MPFDGTNYISRKVDWAVEQGVVVVTMAGNLGPGDRTIKAPGDSKLAITVGATNQNGTAIVQSSGRGPTLDGRIKPDIVAPGVGLLTTGAKGENATTEKCGTSLSTALITGVTALIRESHPEWTAEQLKNSILRTALDRGPLGPDNVYGHGLIAATAAVKITGGQDERNLELSNFGSNTTMQNFPNSLQFLQQSNLTQDEESDLKSCTQITIGKKRPPSIAVITYR